MEWGEMISGRIRRMTALGLVVLSVAACGGRPGKVKPTPASSPTLPSTPTALPTGTEGGLGTTTSVEQAASRLASSRPKGSGLGASPQTLSPDQTTPAASGEADGDVTIKRCDVAAEKFKAGGATITVTNHASSRKSYTILISFNTPDGKTQMDVGAVTAGPLDPGQSTSAFAPSATDFTGSAFTCRVLQVHRDEPYSSP